MTEEPEKAKQLPDPKGYKLLIALPEPDEKRKAAYSKRLKRSRWKKLVPSVGSF